MPVRILLGGMPWLLMDAISAILVREDGMTVVARLDEAADVAASVRALQPDVVLLRQEGEPDPGSDAALFAVCAGLRVVVVIGTGDRGALYRMGTGPALLPRLSAAQLVRAVRGTAPARPARGRRRQDG